MKAEQIIDEMQASLTKLRGHFRKTETAEDKLVFPSFDAKVHIGEKPDNPDPSVIYITPDLPLHAKVAKALGKELVFHDDKLQTVEVETFRGTGLESHAYDPIPDYPNDLVAAMGALEEYLSQLKDGEAEFRWWPGYHFKPYQPFKVTVKSHTLHCDEEAESLPQAICLAIVAHVEQQ